MMYNIKSVIFVCIQPFSPLIQQHDTCIKINMHSFCISCNKYHQKGFKKHEFKLNQQLLQYLNSLSTSVYHSFVLFFLSAVCVNI